MGVGSPKGLFYYVQILTVKEISNNMLILIK